MKHVFAAALAALFTAACGQPPQAPDAGHHVATLTDASDAPSARTCCDCLAFKGCFAVADPDGSADASDVCVAGLDAGTFDLPDVCTFGSADAYPQGICTSECEGVDDGSL